VLDQDVRGKAAFTDVVLVNSIAQVAENASVQTKGVTFLMTAAGTKTKESVTKGVELQEQVSKMTAEESHSTWIVIVYTVAAMKC